MLRVSLSFSAVPAPCLFLAKLARLPSTTSHSVRSMASTYSKYLLIGLPALAVAGLAALWWQRREKRQSYKEVGRVSELLIYPLKSCKGIRVDQAKCFLEGMEFDR